LGDQSGNLPWEYSGARRFELKAVSLIGVTWQGERSTSELAGKKTIALYRIETFPFPIFGAGTARKTSSDN
jgi:hypothetical protein